MLPVHLMKAGEQANEDEEKRNPCARNKETISETLKRYLSNSHNRFQKDKR